MTLEYDLEIRAIEKVICFACVSLLPECSIVSVYFRPGTWGGGRKTVRRNSSIDKAILSGKPLPFILAIRSLTAAGDAIDDSMLHTYTTE